MCLERSAVVVTQFLAAAVSAMIKVGIKGSATHPFVGSESLCQPQLDRVLKGKKL